MLFLAKANLLKCTHTCLSLYLLAQELRGLGYKKGKPLGLVGVTELSEDQKKQLKEQQEVIASNYCKTA